MRPAYRPGHELKFPLLIVARKVDLAGLKAAT